MTPRRSLAPQKGTRAPCCNAYKVNEVNGVKSVKLKRVMNTWIILDRCTRITIGESVENPCDARPQSASYSSAINTEEENESLRVYTKVSVLCVDKVAVQRFPMPGAAVWGPGTSARADASHRGGGDIRAICQPADDVCGVDNQSMPPALLAVMARSYYSRFLLVSGSSRCWCAELWRAGATWRATGALLPGEFVRQPLSMYLFNFADGWSSFIQEWK